MQATPFDRVTAEPFLAALGYDPANPVGLEFRGLKPGNAVSLWPKRGSPFWGDLQRTQNEGFNIYFGVCPRGEGQKGDKEHVLMANALWVDVDGKTFDPVDVSRGTVLALDHIKTTLTPDLGPTYYIASGHGWHLYWLLQNPFSFDLDGSGTYYENLLRRIAVPLRGDPAVAERARVMRLPGSWNLKDQANPLPCEVMESHPDRKFTIDVFEKAFSEQRDSSSGWQHKAAQTGGKVSPSKKTLEFLAFGADEGSRNCRAFEAAADLAGCGFSEEETLEKILDAARKCGLPEAEAKSAVRSAFSRDRTPSTGFSASPPPSDASEADLDAALNALPLTDAGQAEAIVLLYGDRLRYDHTKGCWLKWGEHCWEGDVDGEAYRLAIKTARRRLLAIIERNANG